MSVGTLYGLRVIESPHLTVGPFEDWSGVRSHGRARRRRRKGHRQNVTFYRLPDPKLYQTAAGELYGHPETIRRLREAIPHER